MAATNTGYPANRNYRDQDGDDHFDGNFYLKVASVAATGTTAANAATLTLSALNCVSAADATKGVVLPAAVEGAVVWVKNEAAAVLKIWPATGDQVNAVTVDGAFSIAASTSVCLIAKNATTWYSFPLLPS
jgi:hypothetical protein